MVGSFTEEEILAAKTELTEFVGMVVPSGHRDTVERTAAYLYAKELIALVEELDKGNRLPKIVVCSDQLVRIPLGKKGLSPSDTVPISARMNDLEETVKKLCNSFDKFRSDNRAPSFANIASSNTGTVPRTRPGQVMTAGAWHGAPPPALSVSGPSPQGGPGSDRGEHDGRQCWGL